MQQIERLMARRQVDAEIKTDPIDIVVYRKPKVADGAGGWRWGPPTPVNGGRPQTVLIAPAKRRLSDMLVNTELGDVVDYPYIIVAKHDAELQRGDLFTWNGDKFEVKTVHIKTEVSTIAQVDYYAGATNG